MTTASGVNKQLRIKKESAWGTLAGTSDGQILRRVTSNFNLTKDAYQSQEIRVDRQVSDYRHGLRRAAGEINGELSPGTYSLIMAAILAKDFAAVTAVTGLGITISGSGPYTVKRAAGDWTSSTIRVGHVVRLSAGSFAAGNLAKNLLVTAMDADDLTVIVLNGTALTAEGPISGSTVTAIGKVSYTPSTGHTDDSFTVEEWYPDVARSEVFSGCKPESLDIELPATGLATLAARFSGKDLTATDTSAYFSSPAAATSTGILAAVNGVVTAGGAAVGLITGMRINVAVPQSGDAVVGSNAVSDLVEGRIVVTGQVTVKFTNHAFLDYFDDETEVALQVVLTSSNAAAADFVSLLLPRCKFGGASKDDGEKEVIQTLPFQALLNTGEATNYMTATTLLVQDSQAA